MCVCVWGGGGGVVGGYALNLNLTYEIGSIAIPLITRQRSGSGNSTLIHNCIAIWTVIRMFCLKSLTTVPCGNTLGPDPDAKINPRPIIANQFEICPSNVAVVTSGDVLQLT